MRSTARFCDCPKATTARLSSPPTTRSAPMDIATKHCPDCGESIRANARICRFCRFEFWPADAGPLPSWADQSTTAEGVALTSPGPAKLITPPAETVIEVNSGPSALKVFLILVLGLPILLFIVFVVSEEVSDTEYYASSVGLSISECRDVATRLGMPYSAADSKCRERIPKRK